MTTYSVIVVVYNHLELTKNCLDSIFNCSRGSGDLELVITDNGSTDGTAEYLKEMQEKYKGIVDIVIIINDENKWFIKPVNNAIRKARGKYITLIGNDTEVCDNWLEDLTAPFTFDSKIGITGVWGQSCTLSAWGRGYFGKRVDYIDGTFLTIPREVIDEVSLDINGEKCLFDEETFLRAYCEDADLSLRVTQAGYKLERVKVDVKHYAGGTSRDVPLAGAFLQHNHSALIRKWGLDKNDKYKSDKEEMIDEMIECGGIVKSVNGRRCVVTPLNGR